MNILGFKAVLYLVGGTDEAPTYTAFQGISDCNLAFTRAELNASSRDSEINDIELGMADIAITGKMLNNPDNVGFAELEASLITRSSLRVLALDAAKTVNGAKGYCFDAKNSTWTHDESLGAVIYKDFSLKPCPSSYPKKKAIVTAGEVVLTSI
jgi:hypothetical protein